MNNFSQDVKGDKNRVLSISPENNNPINSTTNVYNQKEVEEIYSRRIHQHISSIVLFTIIILFLLVCILLVKINQLENQLQNIIYKIDFT